MAKQKQKKISKRLAQILMKLLLILGVSHIFVGILLLISHTSIGWLDIIVGLLCFLLCEYEKINQEELEEKEAQEAAAKEELEKKKAIANEQLKRVKEQIAHKQEHGETGVGNFVVIDVETTGLDYYVDKVIQVAAVQYINHKEACHFVSYVNPGRSIPLSASRVNGITDDMVQLALKFKDIQDVYFDFIQCSPLVVGYNVNFDLKFLSAEADTNLSYPTGALL